MKRIKRTFTQDERTLFFDFWKKSAGFSEIGRIIEAESLLLCPRSSMRQTHRI
jgi:hypothetical protein